MNGRGASSIPNLWCLALLVASLGLNALLLGGTAVDLVLPALPEVADAAHGAAAHPWATSTAAPPLLVQGGPTDAPAVARPAGAAGRHPLPPDWRAFLPLTTEMAHRGASSQGDSGAINIVVIDRHAAMVQQAGQTVGRNTPAIHENR